MSHFTRDHQGAFAKGITVVCEATSNFSAPEVKNGKNITKSKDFTCLMDPEAMFNRFPGNLQ
jgi:hypothetical protein